MFATFKKTYFDIRTKRSTIGWQEADHTSLEKTHFGVYSTKNIDLTKRGVKNIIICKLQYASYKTSDSGVISRGGFPSSPIGDSERLFLPIQLDIQHDGTLVKGSNMFESFWNSSFYELAATIKMRCHCHPMGF